MNKDPRKRAEKLISKLSVSEKIGQLCQLPANGVDAVDWIIKRQPGSFLHITRDQTRSLQELALKTGAGIPLLFGIDAIHGHAFDRDSCVFPTQLALSCSWNPELVREIGRITAKEVASTGMHWTFSPVLCIGRDPRWGRTDETFGEDPFLASELAVALIQGLQGSDPAAPDSIIACAKHYLAHGETQGGRDSSESDVSMRKLLTYFYPPFAAAANAGCASFMTAYQSIDGTPCTARRDLLKEMLKKEPGYNAFIVTDWNNVERMVNEQFVFHDLVPASAAAVESGNDMIMSTPGFYEAAHKALENGSLSAQAIHSACLEILTAKYRCGLFDNPFPQDEITISGEEKESFRKKAFQAACESIVILKNNGVLPLTAGEKKIALIGPAADDFIGQLGDWSFGPDMNHSQKVTDMHMAQTVTILQGLQNMPGADIRYHRGCHMTDPADESISEAVKAAEKSEFVILTLGDTIELNGEMRDRASLDLPGAQARLAAEVIKTGKPVVLVLQSGRPLDITAFSESTAAIIQCWNSGIEGGNALAAILTGAEEPEGRLTISWPRYVGQIPVFYNQIPGWHNDRYADMTAQPLYPFGHGLSYTSFLFSNLECLGSEYSISGSAHISGSVVVRNSGKRKGSTVVQIYVRDCVSSVTTPLKSLKWFRRIKLEAGESRQVEFSIQVKDFSLVNSSLERVVEPGEFILYAGENALSADSLSRRIMLV